MALPPALASKLGFLKRKPIQKVIGETTFAFYPFRTSMLAEILSLSGPIAKAMTMLLQGDRAMRDIESKSVTNDDKRAGFSQTVIDTKTPAASLEHLKARAAERAEAIDMLVKAATGDLLARMVADSMRDDFPAGTAPEHVREFWDSLDFDSAMAMLSGAMEANAAVIRPFLPKGVSSLREEAGEALRRAVQERLRGAPTEPEPEATPSLSMVPKTSDNSDETSSGSSAASAGG